MTLTMARIKVTPMKTAMPRRMARHPLDTFWLPRSKIKHWDILVETIILKVGNLFNLKDGDGGGENSVDGEKDVWRSHGENAIRVILVIFILQVICHSSFQLK